MIRSSPRPLYWAMSTEPAIARPPPVATIKKLIGKQRETAATPLFAQSTDPPGIGYLVSVARMFAAMIGSERRTRVPADRSFGQREFVGACDSGNREFDMRHPCRRRP